MSEKWYRLYCDNCHYNRWTDGTDIKDLVPYKRSPIQSGIPKLDPVTKKVVEKKPITLPKQFKCPKCGYLIRPKKYARPDEVLPENEQQTDTQGSEASPGGPTVS
jgi:ribosomal protein S27AE